MYLTMIFEDDNRAEVRRVTYRLGEALVSQLEDESWGETVDSEGPSCSCAACQVPDDEDLYEDFDDEDFDYEDENDLGTCDCQVCSSLREPSGPTLDDLQKRADEAFGEGKVEVQFIEENQ